MTKPHTSPDTFIIRLRVIKGMRAPPNVDLPPCIESNSKLSMQSSPILHLSSTAKDQLLWLVLSHLFSSATNIALLYQPGIEGLLIFPAKP